MFDDDPGTDGVGDISRNNRSSPTLETATRPRRTVRQQDDWPNSEKTAERSNGEIASPWPHTQPTGGRPGFPIGSASAFASASVLQSRTIPGRPPDRGRSTETALTAIENRETVLPTVKKRREPATAFDLPRLIRPQPLRCRQSERKAAIKPFYIQLAAYIFSSRYATASQVLRRFPELLGTERTAQRHLQNMANHGLIAVASTRGTSPNFPFAYFATRKGIGFLKASIPNGDQFQIPATEERRSRGKSLHSVLHELFATEFALMLDRTAQSREDLEIVMQERRYFRSNRRLTYFEEGTTKRIEPDFGFLPTITNGVGERSLLPLHFVEVELGTHRTAAIKDKLTAYDKWATMESRDYLHSVIRRFDQRKMTSNFRLLIISCDAYGGVGDDSRLLDLLTQSVLMPSRTRDRIWLCKAADLNLHSHEPIPLVAPIWIRAKDAQSLLSDLRRQTVDGRQQGSESYAQTRKLLSSKLETIRRHVLFPHQN